MRVTLEEVNSYDGADWRWKVISGGNAGFVLSGREETYRSACRQAKRACKRLRGIDFLPYQKLETE